MATDKQKRDVVNVEALAKDHAQKLYQKTTSWIKRVNEKDLEIDVSFDQLERETFPCEYGKPKDLTDDKRLKQETLYKNKFDNETSTEQISKVSEQRKTTSYATVSVRKGILGIKLEFNLPNDVANASQLPAAWTIAKEQEISTEVKEITHNIEKEFHIAPHKTVEVAVHVTQAEYSRTFTFQTKLSGPVLLTCRKKGTRKAIQTQTAQLSEILKQCKGPWKITGNEVTITTEGEVDLHYFTDEKTLMEEEEEGSRGGCRDGRGGAPRYSRR